MAIGINLGPEPTAREYELYSDLDRLRSKARRLEDENAELKKALISSEKQSQVYATHLDDVVRRYMDLTVRMTDSELDEIRSREPLT